MLPSPPGAAFADGVVGFLGLVVSDLALKPDTKRLRWAPAALGDYVHYVAAPIGGHTLPIAGEVSPLDGHVYGDGDTYEANVDVVVTIPSGYTGPLKIIGGRNIRVVGGALAPVDEGADWIQTRSILSSYGASGEVFVEGVYIDGGATSIERDAINVTGANPVTGITYAPDVTLQQIRVDRLHGNSNQTTPRPDGTIGNHSDCFQPYGPIGRVRIDRFSGRSSYQGLFLYGIGGRLARSNSGEADFQFQAYDPDAGPARAVLYLVPARRRPTLSADQARPGLDDPAFRRLFSAHAAWPQSADVDPDDRGRSRHWRRQRGVAAEGQRLGLRAPGTASGRRLRHRRLLRLFLQIPRLPAGRLAKD